MIVTTTENIAGQEVVESLGQVFGVVVRSRGLAGNIVAGLRTIIGGEIKEYSALVEDTRRHAIDRLVMNARLMGADAVVMMRFDPARSARP
ncbi:YbjQ family protein [Novosphingobium pokkalii]|uniref:YbjQ family protein n=1 Tax=Novosphingobium pokkalii TaxID=1770194 RepID=UPI003642E524